MTKYEVPYGYTREVRVPFDQAVERITAALKNEGFGVLTRIDVKDTLKKKIIKPQSMFEVVRKPGMEPLVAEADEKLKRALENL